MVLMMAAWAPAVVMEYVSNDWRMNGSAWVAVRHWAGYGAPAQVFDVGAIDSSCEAVRLDRGKIACLTGLAIALVPSVGTTARAAKLKICMSARRLCLKTPWICEIEGSKNLQKDNG